MAGKTMKKRGGFYAPDAVRHQNKLPKVKRGGMSCGTKKAKKGGNGYGNLHSKELLGGMSCGTKKAKKGGVFGGTKKAKKGGVLGGTKKAKRGGMAKMIDSIKKMLGGSSKRGARSKTHPGRKDYTTKKGDKDFHHKMKGHREEKMKGRTPYHKRK